MRDFCDIFDLFDSDVHFFGDAQKSFVAQIIEMILDHFFREAVFSVEAVRDLEQKAFFEVARSDADRVEMLDSFQDFNDRFGVFESQIKGNVFTALFGKIAIGVQAADDLLADLPFPGIGNFQMQLLKQVILQRDAPAELFFFGLFVIG